MIVAKVCPLLVSEGLMRRFLLSSLSAVALLAACGPAEDLTSVPAAVFDEATTTQLASNPLLAEWTDRMVACRRSTRWISRR